MTKYNSSIKKSDKDSKKSNKDSKKSEIPPIKSNKNSKKSEIPPIKSKDIELSLKKKSRIPSQREDSTRENRVPSAKEHELSQQDSLYREYVNQRLVELREECPNLTVNDYMRFIDCEWSRCNPFAQQSNNNSKKKRLFSESSESSNLSESSESTESTESSECSCCCSASEDELPNSRKSSVHRETDEYHAVAKKYVLPEHKIIVEYNKKTELLKFIESQVAGSQHYKCANKPGKRIAGLENYEC